MLEGVLPISSFSLWKNSVDNVSDWLKAEALK